MKRKKYNFIYKTTNKLNGVYYMGVHSTDDLDDGYLGSGLLLNKAIRKYGKANFSRKIIKFCNSPQEAFKLEEKLVTESLIKSRKVYNRAVGGQGGYLGALAINKMRNSKKGKPTWNSGTKRVHKCLKCEEEFKDYNYKRKLCRKCWKKSNTGKNNANFKGYYITPKGRFESAKAASQANNKPETTIRRWCKNNIKNYRFLPVEVGFCPDD